MHPELVGGRYRVGTAVGRGGMGTVWLCRDEKLQRDVAVKQVGLLPGESVTDSARALREARSSAALSHRNVVTVFDVVEEDGAIWLVMEYLPSRSLADLVTQEGALDPARVAGIGAQVADGLAAAHAAGTMHRDVKPGNVLVRADGLAKISDFGIARSAGDPALTQSGLLTGTPSYFSPELAHGEAPTPASDVWALGATLYAAVEGRPPYRLQENPIAVLHEIASRQPSAPRRADFLEPALLRMLDRDPGSRWSMDDAAHALRRLVQEHPQHTSAQTRAWAAPDQDPARAVMPVAARRPAVVAAPVDRRERPSQPAPAAVRDPDGTGPGRPAGPDPGLQARRRRAGGLVLAVLALLMVVGGIVYALTRGTPDDARTARDGTTAGRSTASSSGSAPPSGSESASSSGSPSPSGSGSASSSRSPSSSTSRSASPSGSAAAASGAPSADLAARAAFLSGYFEVAGTDAGWAQLGSAEQSVGRASYDRFWRTVDSAQVSDVTAAEDDAAEGDAVEATIRYRFTDGRVVVERQRLLLQRSGDGFLIDDDDVLSSRTVSG